VLLTRRLRLFAQLRHALKLQALARGFIMRLRYGDLREQHSAAIRIQVRKLHFYVGIAPALTTVPRLHSQSGHRRARAVKEVANKKVQRQRWMKLHRPMAFARIQREVQRKRRLALRVGSAFFSVPADCFEFMVQCSCSGTSSISRSLHTEAHVYAQSWGSAC
jgi:hypothetical protein